MQKSELELTARWLQLATCAVVAVYGLWINSAKPKHYRQRTTISFASAVIFSVFTPVPNYASRWQRHTRVSEWPAPSLT